MKLNKGINQKVISPSISIGSADEYEDCLPVEQSIKLSVVTQYFPPDYAATGQLIEELVKQLEQQGVNIEVFTSQPGYAFSLSKAPYLERVDTIKIQRSRSAQLFPGRIRGKLVNGILYTLRTLVYLLRASRRNDILLVTTAPPFLPIVGYLANLLFKLPYVCIIYDLYPDIAITLGVVSKNHWVAKLWQAINQRVWLNAKGIVVLSPEMKQSVLAHCPQVAHKVSVIHSWANPEFIVPIAKRENWFAWKYDLVNKFTVLYSGNMGRCHDIETLLKAAMELQDEPVQFVCIGGGAKREELIVQVNELGLNNFTFLPYQDKKDLPYSLTSGDLSLVSINPASESLVLPSKLYSALATGRPLAVVCSPYSSLRQIIAEADCGAAFDYGDGHGLAEFIRLLQRNQKLGEQMGQAARQYLQSNFTPKIIAQQYLDVLRQALSMKDI
ncbi:MULTISPECIES: glycosyltransferase family 4 protein [unclassified Nodularia (in: cyanobacteria)]|uniref:glycosyltransferase family 4 protein n=1 Tax=unclassified Nodularia (in: cyanobacteria) TaxID=2656917 RepID=UPI00187F1634|nr:MULTISPECIES: glycosyltransferase family 4 protein [unclassified Nodularia (in: cyanobacteria)]MBE9199397.1 glycosyltransferase family 4 protein [Nodularia sp. LEGE 06071]MCC2692895.1 glycosyltransferase family 4 protein [Nodularia sp. LEGE 04288]